MLARFDGAVAPLATVDVKALVAWIEAIDLHAWPQQTRRELKPAMVNDLGWFDFGKHSQPIVDFLIPLFPGCTAHDRMLSCVMPRHSIPPHIDNQPPSWICRVHVPLMSNPLSRFTVAGRHYHLDVGEAYTVNTEAIHSVKNEGPTPRIHFMFDVRDNSIGALDA